jgi:hypothetical protein
MNTNFDPKRPHNDLDLFTAKDKFWFSKIVQATNKESSDSCKTKGIFRKTSQEDYFKFYRSSRINDSYEVKNIITTHDKLYKALSVKDICPTKRSFRL